MPSLACPSHHTTPHYNRLPPARLHGFADALTGVGIVGRWALALGGGFGTIAYANGRFDVAADYWLVLAHKRLVAGGVLAVSGADAPDAPALLYASCAANAPAGASWPWDVATLPKPLTASRHPPAGAAAVAAAAAAASAGGNGSIVLLAVNPSTAPVILDLAAAGSGAPIATTPRLAWVFSAPGGNLSATGPLLNGGAASLRIGADGSLPAMPGDYTPIGGAQAVVLPPRSQAFIVLLDARAPACTG